MLFDAHNRSLQALGGVTRRGIYDNMRTAVDKAQRGKQRILHARFAAMCSHYLFDPDFCNVASGWEKKVQDSRRRIRTEAGTRRFGSFNSLAPSSETFDQSRAMRLEVIWQCDNLPRPIGHRSLVRTPVPRMTSPKSTRSITVPLQKANKFFGKRVHGQRSEKVDCQRTVKLSESLGIAVVALSLMSVAVGAVGADRSISHASHQADGDLTWRVQSFIIPVMADGSALLLLAGNGSPSSPSATLFRVAGFTSFTSGAITSTGEIPTSSGDASNLAQGVALGDASGTSTSVAEHPSGSKHFQAVALFQSVRYFYSENRGFLLVLCASITLMLATSWLLLRQCTLLRALRARHSQLQQSTSKLQASLHAIPDTLFEMGLNGRCYDFHLPQSKSSSAPPFRLLGRTVEEVLPPEASRVFLAAIQEAHQTGRSSGRLLSLENVDGKAWFELSVARKAVEPGQAPRFIALARDISERKALQERDKVRLEIFELLARRASLQEILLRIAQYVTRGRPDVTCSIVLLAADGQPLNVGPPPSPHHLAWSEPIVGSSGAELGVLVVGTCECEMRGICCMDRELAREASHLAAGAIERTRIEVALATSEREFRTLAENIPDNIIRYDANCRRTYVNDALQKLVGSDVVCNLVGSAPSETFLENCLSAVEYDAKLRSVLATGEPQIIELIAGNESKQSIHSVRMVAERGSEGRILGVLAIGRDITEHKKREALIEESRDMLRALAVRSETAREEERKRIAREIHDELGQMLTAQRLDISTLRLQFGKDNPLLIERCESLKDITDQTIQVVRNIASSLRPASLDMGVTAALEWLTADLRMRTGLKCRLHAREEDLDFSEEQSIAVFRIVQESLTNIVRHAQAREVVVSVEATEALYFLSVSDDGIGFEPDIVQSRSFGLVGIRERALMMHGEARIISSKGAGTRVEVHIPRYPAADLIL